MQLIFLFQECVFITLSGQGRRETPGIRPRSRYTLGSNPKRPQKFDLCCFLLLI